MDKVLKKITNFLSYFFASGCFLSMFFLFFIIFTNSSKRYILGDSYEWGEELSIYISIYGIMFGIAWAYLQDRHVKFDILVRIMSKKYQLFFEYLTDCVSFVISVLFSYSGYMFMIKRGDVDASSLLTTSQWLSEITSIKYFLILGKLYPYYFSMCFGGFILAVSVLIRFLNRIFNQEVSTKEVFK